MYQNIYNNFGLINKLNYVKITAICILEATKGV